jgi:RNA polymerase sigma-70 factor (ECF subfamily)
MTLFSGDNEAALDGVSHAFTQALINKLMLEAMPEPAMKAWLYAAARNAVVDIKRRETRFYRFTGEHGNCDIADPRPDETLGKAIAELLIEKLPESLRIPVEMKYYGGMNSTEIGEAMNIPAATVRTRLRAALRQLREKN